MSIVLGGLWILAASFIIAFLYARCGHNYSWRESAKAGGAVVLLVLIGSAITAAIVGVMFAFELIFGSLGVVYLLGALILFVLFMTFKEGGKSILTALRDLLLFLGAVALLAAPFFIFA